jgi:D-alanyl-D-alanine carboxypeptidase
LEGVRAGEPTPGTIAPKAKDTGMVNTEIKDYVGLPEKGQTDCTAVDLGIFRR